MDNFNTKHAGFLSICHEGLLVHYICHNFLCGRRIFPISDGASPGVSSMYGIRPYSTAIMNKLLRDLHVTTDVCARRNVGKKVL